MIYWYVVHPIGKIWEWERPTVGKLERRERITLLRKIQHVVDGWIFEFWWAGRSRRSKTGPYYLDG